MSNKYSWFKGNPVEFELPYRVIHTENDGKITSISASDTAEKADFITKACNGFNIEENEDEILPNLKKSTQSLSQISNKDEWLNEIRGNEDELRQLLRDILKYLEHLETQQTLHDFFDKELIRQALK